MTWEEGLKIGLSRSGWPASIPMVTVLITSLEVGRLNVGCSVSPVGPGLEDKQRELKASTRALIHSSLLLMQCN